MQQESLGKEQQGDDSQLQRADSSNNSSRPQSALGFSASSHSADMPPPPRQKKPSLGALLRRRGRSSYDAGGASPAVERPPLSQPVRLPSPDLSARRSRGSR